MKIEQLFALDFLLKNINNDSQIWNYGVGYQLILSDNGVLFSADLITINDKGRLVNPIVDSDGVVESKSYDRKDFLYYYNVVDNYRIKYFRGSYQSSEVTKFPALYIEQLVNMVKNTELPKKFIIENPIASNITFLETDIKLDTMLISENCKLISLKRI